MSKATSITKKIFFGKETNLTVSGQLEGETYALALSEIYTFGPTFRAENSNTTRHLAEFWMIEPEMAFYDIQDNMQLATDLLQYLVKYALDNCKDDLEFLHKRAQDEENTKPQDQRSELRFIGTPALCYGKRISETKLYRRRLRFLKTPIQTRRKNSNTSSISGVLICNRNMSAT
jgi:aspartyl/asparaginyl-tRNA synthetase